MTDVPDILMLTGASVWLAGEIYGVVRDAHGYHGPPDTTSGWVWALEKRFRSTRILVAFGLVVLGIHFLEPKWL